jgi:hypothetical protein
MTTRNFRVNNGISIGDVVIDASTNKITGLSTATPSDDGDVATKAYVDAQVTASDLDFQGDSGGALSIDLDSEVLDIAGGTGIDTTGSGNTLTVAIDSTVATLAGTQTFTNKTFDANGTGNSISNIEVADLASGVLDTDISTVSGSDDTLASAKAIKTYVDDGLAGLSQTSISQLDSSVTVSDSGSNGAVTIACDGNNELVINDTSATFSGNVVVTGNFTVNGTTTTVATTNTTNTDNIYELGTGTTGTPSNDAGIVIERGDSNNAFIGFDESEDKFKVGTGTFTGANTGNLTITTGTLIANIEGNVTGNVTGNTSGSSGSCTGNSATATEATNVTVTANNSANETVYLAFVDGATGTQGIETDTGLSYNPSTNVLSTTASAAQYADVAERFEADAPMEIGSVVEVGGSAEITEATSDLSEDVFGVISDKPAYMMNAGAGDNTTHPFVAMTGRTPVRVIGEVTKGQRLVTSSTKGCARAVAQGESISPFNVIGRALESNTEAGIKLVNCAVRTNN